VPCGPARASLQVHPPWWWVSDAGGAVDLHRLPFAVHGSHACRHPVNHVGAHAHAGMPLGCVHCHCPFGHGDGIGAVGPCGVNVER
jgi:hypothetical protein